MSPQASPQAAQAVRRALALLGAVSADWRQKGPSDGSAPLYWPIAVAAARAQLRHALTQMAAERALLREAAVRLRGWSAGAGPDGALIARLEAACRACPDCGSTDEGHATPCGGRRTEPGPYRTAIQPG